MRRSRGRFPEHVHHGARRLGIGVVAIVQNQNAVALEPLAAHLARRKLANRVRELLRLDAEDSGHRDARQQIQNAVAAGQRALEFHAAHAEARAASSYNATSSARTSASVDSARK